MEFQTLSTLDRWTYIPGLTNICGDWRVPSEPQGEGARKLSPIINSGKKWIKEDENKIEGKIL